MSIAAEGDGRTNQLGMWTQPEPRGKVTRTIPVLRPVWLSFAWAAPSIRLDAQELARLDAWWSAAGLTGAVIVHSGRRPALPPGRVKRAPDLKGATVRACRVPDLCLNVLLRARGPLLLAEMPLLDSGAGLERTTLFTDDPRLVAMDQNLAPTHERQE